MSDNLIHIASRRKSPPALTEAERLEQSARRRQLTISQFKVVETTKGSVLIIAGFRNLRSNATHTRLMGFLSRESALSPPALDCGPFPSAIAASLKWLNDTGKSEDQDSSVALDYVELIHVVDDIPVLRECVVASSFSSECCRYSQQLLVDGQAVE